MKILSMSNIYGDFGAFDKSLKVVRESGADVLAISGGLAGNFLEGNEKKHFSQIYGTFKDLVKPIYQATKGKVNTIRGVAEYLGSKNIVGILSFGNSNAGMDLKGMARDYLQLEEKVRETTLKQYEMFKERFDSLSQKVFLVPGMGDRKCIDDILAKENIHNKTQYEFNGVTFVGYGGGRRDFIEIPSDLRISFNEHEAFEHFIKHGDSEVVLTHLSPWLFKDGKIYGGENILSHYINVKAPTLLLAGDSYAPRILKADNTDETFVMNPGKLGKYDNDNSGSFLEIDIDENLFVKNVEHYVLRGDSFELKDVFNIKESGQQTFFK